MNLYEQAICYFAYQNPVIADMGGCHLPMRREGAIPFLLEFWKVFPEMIKNGMVEQIESWPMTMYSISQAGLQAALEIWKKHGYKATWIQPGCIGLERWKR